jgi:hypothetical protein
MECEQVRPLLLDYVMEEVTPQERAPIARHLETCAACSAEAGKFRQTLGALAQGAAFEDPPQKIRMVAEPSSYWVAFWRNPARLAFAGGALACVAVAILALASATISYQDGSLQIAFGAAAPPAQSPAAAPLPSATALAGPFITRSEAAELIAEAVAASEARLSAESARLLQIAARQNEEDRLNDRRELAESLRYFQAAQVNMWKQQVENQQIVSALVQRTGLDASSRP